MRGVDHRAVPAAKPQAPGRERVRVARAVPEVPGDRAGERIPVRGERAAGALFLPGRKAYLMNKKVAFENLGRIRYKEAWDYQERLFETVIKEKLEKREEQKPLLLFC